MSPRQSAPSPLVTPRQLWSLLRRIAAGFAVIVVLATAGFMLIEGWGALDALYMTVITLTTVGFQEVHPLSSAGRAFAIAVILAGVSAAAFLFGTITEFILSGQLTGSLRRQRMERDISRLTAHQIVCGYGRVGRQVAHDLAARNADIVVIESSPDVVPPDGPLVSIVGDASDDGVLERAGIARAAGVAVCTGNDAVNIVVTLTAHTLNPRAVIVARANRNSSEAKLRRAGAAHVISPHRIGANRIATQLLNPRITEFLNVMMDAGALELVLEELTVHAESALAGKTLGEARLEGLGGANVLAIAGGGGPMTTNPPAEHRFAPGDVLITLGTTDQLQNATRLAGDEGTAARLGEAAEMGA